MMNESLTDDRGVLRFLTCGSVDDGKSTLIGRLLYDTQAILADTLHAISATSRRRGLSALDLSLLTDGLSVEREQGITIDVAYRYFSTGRRKFIIADAPGHEQYTRNMVTAATNADLAVILVDATKGVLPQTRRHALIVALLGIPNVILAINKMDLLDYRQEAFAAMREDFSQLAQQLGIQRWQAIPLSALHGDMVVERGDRLGWYEGPTLLAALEEAEIWREFHAQAFRFPVQYVCRPWHPTNPKLRDYRGYMGRIASGGVCVGDAVEVLPGRQKANIAGIELGGEPLSEAVAGQSVTILLDRALDVSRGNLLVHVGEGPAERREICADLCWLDEMPLTPQRRYRLRHGPCELFARVEIGYRYRCEDFSHEAVDRLASNDLARVRLTLNRPIYADPYRENRHQGAFILIDETTHATVAAGMIAKA